MGEQVPSGGVWFCPGFGWDRVHGIPSAVFGLSLGATLITPMV